MVSGDIQRRLGRRISELRRKKGFSSQESFADYLNTQRAFIGHLETGRKDFRLSTLIRIAEALNVSLSELFAGVEDDGAAPAGGRAQRGSEYDALVKGVATLELSVRHVRSLVTALHDVPSEPAKKRQEK